MPLSFVDGVLSTVTRQQAADTLVGLNAAETCVVQCALPACRVFYTSENPRCPRCGYPNPEPAMRTAKERKCDDPTHAMVDELTAPSAKRVTAKPKTNGRPMHWECTVCHHKWQAGPAQVKCPQCNAGRGDLRASIEGTADGHRAKAAAKGKIRTWPSGLDSWGTPTWCCPQCEHPHRQSVCPTECVECGEEGNPKQNLTHELPEHVRDRGPIPAETKPAKPETTAAAGETIARPVSASATIDVDLRKILPSPDNPRKTFPKDELDELATSIEAKGLQQPLEILPADVHGLHELVDGERRFKALQQLAAKDKARWKSAPCVVKTLTRDEARDYRLTTFVRSGLNAIDQARAFQARLDAGGMTQAQLGALVGMTQGAIANKIRLTKLPDGVQAKIISGEMTERQGREMVPYADLPGVLEAWAKSAKKEDVTGRAWEYELEDDVLAIADEVSRGVEPYQCDFKLTPELEKELDVRQVGNFKGAFNVKLWTKLQAEAEKKKTGRADKADASGQAKEKTLSPAEQKARAKKQSDIFAKRLYRYKVAWLQEKCVARLNGAPVDMAILLRLVLHFAVEGQSRMNRQEDLGKAITAKGGKKKKSRDHYWSHFSDYESLLSVDPKQMVDVCRLAVASFVNHPFDGYHAGFEPAEIEALAGELAVDLKQEWRLTKEFLELHTRQQLLDLCAEWNGGPVNPSASDGKKRSAIIAEILRTNAEQKKPFACPKELLALKGVRL